MSDNSYEFSDRLGYYYHQANGCDDEIAEVERRMKEEIRQIDLKKAEANLNMVNGLCADLREFLPDLDHISFLDRDQSEFDTAASYLVFKDDEDRLEIHARELPMLTHTVLQDKWRIKRENTPLKLRVYKDLTSLPKQLASFSSQKIISSLEQASDTGITVPHLKGTKKAITLSQTNEQTKDI